MPNDTKIRLPQRHPCKSALRFRVCGFVGRAAGRSISPPAWIRLKATLCDPRHLRRDLSAAFQTALMDQEGPMNAVVKAALAGAMVIAIAGQALFWTAALSQSAVDDGTPSALVSTAVSALVGHLD